jgi:hypothetical protein
MKKKLAGLMLLAIVGAMGITLSSFLAPSEDDNALKPYIGVCPHGGGTFVVCGDDGFGCTPSGTC